MGNISLGSAYIQVSSEAQNLMCSFFTHQCPHLSQLILEFNSCPCVRCIWNNFVVMKFVIDLWQVIVSYFLQTLQFPPPSNWNIGKSGVKKPIYQCLSRNQYRRDWDPIDHLKTSDIFVPVPSQTKDCHWIGIVINVFRNNVEPCHKMEFYLVVNNTTYILVMNYFNHNTVMSFSKGKNLEIQVLLFLKSTRFLWSIMSEVGMMLRLLRTTC